MGTKWSFITNPFSLVSSAISLVQDTNERFVLPQKSCTARIRHDFTMTGLKYEKISTMDLHKESCRLKNLVCEICLEVQRKEMVPTSSKEMWHQRSKSSLEMQSL